MTASDTIREIAAGAEDAARNCGRVAAAAEDILSAVCEQCDMSTEMGQALALAALGEAVGKFIRQQFPSRAGRRTAASMMVQQILQGTV